MSGHDHVDWQDAPEDACAWAVNPDGQAFWLHWDVAHDHFDDGGWVQPGITNNVQRSMTPARLYGWDSQQPWHSSLTLRD